MQALVQSVAPARCFYTVYGTAALRPFAQMSLVQIQSPRFIFPNTLAGTALSLLELCFRFLSPRAANGTHDTKCLGLFEQIQCLLGVT